MLVAAFAACALSAKSTRSCEACLHMVNGLMALPVFDHIEQEVLRREQDSEFGHKYRTSLRLGAIDELLDDAILGNAACAALLTLGQEGARMRRACEKLVEDHGDDFVESLVQWQGGRAAMGGTGTRQGEIRELLCMRTAKVCSSNELDLVPQYTGTTAPDKTHYMSEHAPDPHGNVGPVFQMVGATIAETMANTSSKDVIVLFHRHGVPEEGERWEKLTPMFERLATLLHALPRTPPTFMFVKINTRANDMPPPFHQIGERSTVAIYPKGTKFEGAPSARHQIHLLEWLEPMRLSLAEILNSLHSNPNLGMKLRSHAANLMMHLGDDRLTREDWQTDDEILKHVRAGYDPEDEAAWEQEKARKEARQREAEVRRLDRQRAKEKLEL